MQKESGNRKRPVDQPFTSDTKQQSAIAREARALKKSQKVDDHEGGEEKQSLRENHELTADVLMVLGQNALTGPLIASGGGGGGGGGGKLLLSSVDMSPDVASAMAAEATAQDQVAKDAQDQVEKEEKQRQKRLRSKQRDAMNRKGMVDYEKLKGEMPDGIPQGLLSGKRQGNGVMHDIKMFFIVQPVQSPTYTCNVPDSWNWVVQNFLGDDYTNGVGLYFTSIQPQHAVVMLNPLQGVWCIGPASEDDKCTVTVNGKTVPFDKPAVIVDGDKIMLGTVPMDFTTTPGDQK